MSLAQDADEIRALYLQNTLYYSAVALCCYDYLLTLGDEIAYVWRSKRRLSALLFCGFRYPALLNTVFMILGSRAFPSWQSNHSCFILVQAQSVGAMLTMASAAMFTALRLSAIYDKSLWIFWIVFLTGMTSPAISTYFSVILKPDLVTIGPLTTCAGYVSDDQKSSYNASTLLVIVRSALSLLADALVFVLTWRKLIRAREATRCSMSLVSVLIEDTAIYFLLLCIVNLVGIGLGHFFSLAIGMSLWTLTLTSSLLSRLLLDLHKASESDNTMDTLAKLETTISSSSDEFPDTTVIFETAVQFTTIGELELDCSPVYTMIKLDP
ncbi:hypothetical protein DAEQUDRAFT_722950 [Daedalea quercina L-15889]|uniref:DUF6533 domain-containing protein n=1 Tax=Daedalea quercina L-15889 TaxID=1314783 RepID=A0A165SP46_9APHY|nr:hypothetical protein DAEQUDRAFT_722950 [Daedalea quercina L-15889]